MTKDISETSGVGAGTDDLVWMTIDTVDNRLDDVFGIRPGRVVGRMLTAIAPANVIHSVTDLDKPGEVIEKMMDGIASDIRSKGFVPTSPKHTAAADAAKHPIPSAKEMKTGIEKPVESKPPATEAAGV